MEKNPETHRDYRIHFTSQNKCQSLDKDPDSLTPTPILRLPSIFICIHLLHQVLTGSHICNILKDRNNCDSKLPVFELFLISTLGIIKKVMLCLKKSDE